MRAHLSRIRPAVVLAGLLAAETAWAQHSGDVWVGRSAAGQLTVSPLGYVPADNFHALNRVHGLLKGWSDDSPGFDRVTDSHPELDVYPLEVGAEIWLRLEEIDAAFRMIDQGYQVIDQPGEQTCLGDQDLHVHNTWHINSNGPGYDPQQCVWRAVFVLRDLGATGHSDSAPLEYFFSNVPVRTPDIPASGDFDGDAAVDLDDYAALAECLGGAAVLPEPEDPAITTCVVECLNAFDFDDDRDVDLLDLAVFQQKIGT